MGRTTNSSRTAARRRSSVAAALLSLAAARESRALGIEQCVSADGHVYVIVTTSTASVGTQVTSIAMTSGAVSACMQQGAAGSAVVSAFAGARGKPLANRVRTTVLSGFATNDISCERNFDAGDAGGKGVLWLPGPLPRSVSADPGRSSETVVPIEVADEQVPAAREMRHVRRPMLRCAGDTLAFPMGGDGDTISNGRTGEVGGQAITLDDTAGTRVGSDDANEVPDGFLLQGNCSSPATCQVIVFIGELGADCSLGSSASAAGFAVDGNMTTYAAEAVMHAGGHRECTGAYVRSTADEPFGAPLVRRALVRE